MARGRPKSKPETGEIRMNDSTPKIMPKILTMTATLNKMNTAVNEQDTIEKINYIMDKHYREGYRLHTVQVVADAADSIVLLYVLQMKDEPTVDKTKTSKDAILPGNVGEPVK